MTGYDAATGDDTFLEWDGRGDGVADHGGQLEDDDRADGARRVPLRVGGRALLPENQWTETVAGDGGASTTRTRWTEVYRVGGYEKVVGDGLGSHAWVDKTRAGAAQLVRMAALPAADAAGRAAAIAWR